MVAQLAKSTNLKTQFILASSSPIRKKILNNAGYVVQVVTPEINEAQIRFVAKATLKSPNNTAKDLAKEKAIAVSKNYPERHVLAADQILTCGDRWYSKPSDQSAAQEQLLCLSDKLHVLHTAVCLISPNAELWTHTEESYLTMRYLSGDFITQYLLSIGSSAFNSAGCYQLERQGSQLFERIEGDFFAILGLPLIPIMRQLRNNEIVPL
jgi:septum formation protein